MEHGVPLSLSLQGFLHAPAPSSVGRLPRTFGMIPEKVYNTNFEYLLKMGLEARRVLQRGDAQVKSLQFNTGTLECYFDGVRAIHRFFKDGTTPTQMGHTAIQDMPRHLRLITSYHSDKVVACEIEFNRLSSTADQMRDRFVAACEQGDYKALAEIFYPDCDVELEIEPEDELPDFLRGKIEFSEEWYAKERARRIGAAFNNATQLTWRQVKAELGEPETGVPDGAFSFLSRCKVRNAEVYRGAVAFITQFEDVLRGNDPKPAEDSVHFNPA